MTMQVENVRPVRGVGRQRSGGARCAPATPRSAVAGGLSSRRRLRRALAGIGVAVALLGATARADAAGAPIMALGDVTRGARCTAASVLEGTAIASFDVTVLDVIAGSVTGEGPRILVRVSGPGVEATGIGPGFSGSPIFCPDAQGVPRVVGAISEGAGDATNHLALATPIQAILDEPLSPSDRARPRAVPVARHRSLEAVSLAGAAPWLARVAAAGASRVGRTLLSAPPRSPASFAPVDLQPGSAVAVGWAGGDLALSAIGTVAYRDGDTLWAFGHALDGAGRRALLLQDAYVYGVVDNPGFAGASFKLAAPGHVVGTLGNDAANAVVGRLGGGPPTFPFDVVARDADRGATTRLHLDVADESAVGDPSGSSPLRLVGALAAAQATAAGLDGAPARQTATMCLQLSVRHVPRPLGFCNRYVDAQSAADGLGLGVADLVAEDVDQALAYADDNTFAALPVSGVRVSVTQQRGLRQALLLGASAPARVRAGQRIAVRLALRQFRGRRVTETFGLRVPRGLRPGTHLLELRGTPADTGGDLAGLFADIFADDGDRPAAASLAELAGLIRAIHRFDGISARWHGDGARRVARPVFVSAAQRISGTASVALRVVRPRRSTPHAG
jgi:hypothetical protein